MNLPESQRLNHLVTATHTPFRADGSLNLAAVEQQAAHLLKNGVGTVFIGGTTGESSSLTLDERRALAQRWMEVACGSALRVVVHVGSNCLADALALAAQAQQLGAAAIAALAPSYFKPASLDVLIACCADIAAAAPETPFYYYDIPSMTGVSFPMPEFLEKARACIPNLAGIKFTNPDLMAYQLCLRADGGGWDVPFGLDDPTLAAVVDVFTQRVEVLPVVAEQANRSGSFGVKEREQLGDRGAAAKNRHMEKRHRMNHAAREWLRSRAFREQEVFPVRDSVLSSAKAMPDERADGLNGWHGLFSALPAVKKSGRGVPVAS